ncbi:hypothetical protein A9W97_02095 [Mycobacterium gordonae]|nr:hypothetical protein A9W97_02095 [Mycobacterium gordonae]
MRIHTAEPFTTTRTPVRSDNRSYGRLGTAWAVPMFAGLHHGYRSIMKRKMAIAAVAITACLSAALSSGGIASAVTSEIACAATTVEYPLA